MLSQAQRDTIDSISAFMNAHRDVEALWLSGSLGMGEGDEYSDVDFLVLTPADKLAHMPADLKAGIARSFRPIFVNDLFGRVLNFITADWIRFDLSLVTPPELARFDAAHLKLLFNKGENSVPSPQQAPYAPNPTAVEKLCTEFIRILGLSAVCIGRGEYDVLLSGIDHLRRITIDLMMEENAVPPARRGGVLKRYPFLTAEQRRDLAQIPAAGADRQSTIAANQAFARIFIPRAKALCTKTGVAWPDAFENATRAHLSRAGVSI